MPKSAEARGNTPTVAFRFSPETLAQIDRLAEFHGLQSRSDLLRFLVTREFRAISAPKKSGKKSA